MHETLRQSLISGQQQGARYRMVPPSQTLQGHIGSQYGRNAGSSLEFRDHRVYQPGDDLRRIDWSAFARSDQLNIKLYREEVNPHLDLLVDGSRSMDLPGSAKASAALALAAALSVAAANGGFTHEAWLTDQGCRPIANGNLTPEAWDGISFQSEASVDDAIAVLSPRWRPKSVRFLISDLLWMGDPLSTLQPMHHQASALVVIQLLSREDADPPPLGNTRLVDSETGQMRELFVDAAAQQRYRSAMDDHQENWHRAASSVGAVMVTLIAEDLMDGWDLSALMEREILRVA